MPNSLSRSDLFGLADLRASKMEWLRRQPDLRMGVIVKLARVLRWKPHEFFRRILLEEQEAPLRQQRFVDRMRRLRDKSEARMREKELLRQRKKREKELIRRHKQLAREVASST